MPFLEEEILIMRLLSPLGTKLPERLWEPIIFHWLGCPGVVLHSEDVSFISVLLSCVGGPATGHVATSPPGGSGTTLLSPQASTWPSRFIGCKEEE